MRTFIPLMLTSLISFSSFASLESGYEIGTILINLDDSTKSRANHHFKMGFREDVKRLGAYFGGEAVYSYTPKTMTSTAYSESGYNTHGVKLRAKADIPLTEHFSGQVRGGLGYQKASYYSKIDDNNSNGGSASGYFPTTSAGLVINAEENLSFSLMANYDARKNMKRKDNTYFTLGFNYTLPGSKTLV